MSSDVHTLHFYLQDQYNASGNFLHRKVCHQDVKLTHSGLLCPYAHTTSRG